MSAGVRWVESSSWELDFYGLPHRVPWPEEADPQTALSSPLNLETLLEAVDRLGDDAGEPWPGFRAATGLFEELSEALEEGELVRCHRLIDEIDRLHGGTSFVLFQRGNLARLEGRDADAVAAYKAIVEKFPGISPAWSNLGVIHAQNGVRDEAVAAFRKALEANPDDQVALDWLTRLRELVRLVRQDAEGKPNPKAVGYVDQQTFRQMLSGQIDSLAENPDQLLGLADQLMRDGLVLDVAVQALEKANGVRPRDPRTVMTLASAYRAAERHEEAREMVRLFTELEPQQAAGFMHLAQACNQLGDAAAERAALARVLELDPNFHPAIGVFFELRNGEHDPAKEEQLSRWASAQKSWMGHLIASSIARSRGDGKSALRHADEAYAVAPDAEEVLLHLSAVLGEQKELNRLATQIRPAVESRSYSARLDWNYAQTLHQLGMRDEASGVLRRALAAENCPEEFKSMAVPTLEAWGGVLTGCGVPLEMHRGEYLTRPILITLPDGDGGIVLGAGKSIPAEGTFPWRAQGDGEIQVDLQQGESGSPLPPRPLGTFRAGRVDTSEGAKPVECHVAVTSEGMLHFRAAQNGQRLPVAWRPPQP
jgi:tetratricopeptide (TPR) repeat protein